MKILCVMVPHFPWRCEVLRQPAIASQPAIVTSTSNSQKRVLDYSPGLEGLQRGMPVQQALARHGEAELLPADMPYYRSIFASLLDRLEEISPLVEGAEPGCAYIDVNGLQFIYSDDKSIINAVFSAISEGFAPQIGLAGNKFLAYLAARNCSPSGYRLLVDDVAAYLKDLPCDVLPVSLKRRERLHSFGLHTLGQVAALPPGPLLAQFGTEGKRIYDLARGRDSTPLYPRMMAETIDESLTLASVTVSLEAVMVALESLLLRVFARIGHSGLGIRSLTAWTRTWDSEQWERTVKFKEPAIDTKTVVTRLRRVLEDYPQPGPVEQVGLRIARLGYPRGRQGSLFTGGRARDTLAEDIRQLELRLGNPQVYRVQEVEPWSRIPERRYTLKRTVR